MWRTGFADWDISPSRSAHTTQLTKTAYVYLPYHYSEEQQYNVLYLMHGGWSDETTYLGTPENPHELKNVLDHFYGLVKNGEFSGRTLYFLFQGASPEKWMLEAGEYTMNRFAKPYGFEYAGMATNRSEAENLGSNI